MAISRCVRWGDVCPCSGGSGMTLSEDDNTGAKSEGKQGQNIYRGNPDTDTFPCVVW